MKSPLLLVSIFLSTFFIKAQDLKNYIPDNAAYIVKINGARINNNVNFDEIRASELYKDFIFKMLNNKTAEERAIIKLFETPDETGLNLKSEMYVYAVPEETKTTSKNEDEYEYDYYAPKIKTTTIVAIPLLNSSKFTGFIKDIFSSSSKTKVMKAAKGLYFIKSSSALIIWNTEKVFLCDLPYRSYYDKGYSKSEIKKITKTISTPAPKNILSHTKVLNALGVDSDLTYIFNSNAWSDMPWLYDEVNRQESIKDSTLFNKDLFKDNYSFSYVNFENGKIIFSGNQFYGEKLAGILNPIFNLKPSPKLANILYQTPVTSYISYAFSFTELQKFVDKTFNYNMDTLLVEFVRESQDNIFDTDSLIVRYRSEIDTIDFIVNGPDEVQYTSDLSTITDSGTVYSDEVAVEAYNEYDYDPDQAKFEHETLNWYQMDSLQARQDTLYDMIYDRKDTLAKKMYQSLGIKGEELWHIFNGEFMVLYHAMTTMDKKYKVYEMDDEFNYVEVEKTKKIPMPLYSFAMTINSDELFNKYLKLMIQKGFIQKEKNRYLVVLGEMNQYIWVKDGLCIMTNDNNFNPAKHSPSTSKSSYEVDNYNRITSHQSGAYIEIGKILGSSIQFTEDKETAEILEILAKYFDEMIYITDFDKQANVSTKTDIVFNEDKKNSINIMYEMINEMYVYFSKK